MEIVTPTHRHKQLMHEMFTIPSDPSTHTQTHTSCAVYYTGTQDPSVLVFPNTVATMNVCS